MKGKWHIPRRTFLKGLGTAIASPMLEAMVPSRLLAATGNVTGAGLPKRMAFVYVPNGVIMEQSTPSGIGADFKLPTTLEPLQPFQKDLLVLSGLAQDKARAN